MIPAIEPGPAPVSEESPLEDENDAGGGSISGRPKRTPSSLRSKYEPIAPPPPPPPAPVVEALDDTDKNEAENAALLAKYEDLDGIQLSLDPIGSDRDGRSYWAFFFRPDTTVTSSIDTSSATEPNNINTSDLSCLCAPRVFSERNLVFKSHIDRVTATDEEHARSMASAEWASFSTGIAALKNFFCLSVFIPNSPILK